MKDFHALIIYFLNANSVMSGEEKGVRNDNLRPFPATARAFAETSDKLRANGFLRCPLTLTLF